MAMPSSMPISRITTLTHIINDPIMRTSSCVCVGQCKRVGVVVTIAHDPWRLCDLKSRKGLAYLS